MTPRSGLVFCGLMVGIAEPPRPVALLDGAIALARPRWPLWSMLLLGLSVAIATWPMVSSDFILQGYY